MNGNFGIYGTAADQPELSVVDDTVHLLFGARYDGFAPYLIVDPEDTVYLERLANTIDDALAEIRQEERTPERHPASYIREAMRLREEVARLEADLDRLREQYNLAIASDARLRAVSGR